MNALRKIALQIPLVLFRFSPALIMRLLLARLSEGGRFVSSSVELNDALCMEGKLV